MRNKFANVLVAICDRFAFILIFYVICHLLTLYKVRSWTQYCYSLAKKMQTSAKKACFQFAECSFSSAKKMQTSAKKACFQFAECSFSSAKIRLFLITSKVLGKKYLKRMGRNKNRRLPDWRRVAYSMSF